MNIDDNDNKKWLCVTHCRNIPLREGRAVQIGGREIAIFNLGDRFLAIDNHCPHKAGPLADGIVSGTTVVCPLHTWKLDLETGKGVSSVSAASCVETYRVRVEQGAIWLELPTEFARKCSNALAKATAITQ
jgi:nitrite reductase (NADH) small subunit